LQLLAGQLPNCPATNAAPAYLSARARAARAIKEELVANLRQAGRATRFHHRGRRAGQPIAIEVLLEHGFQRRTRPGHSPDQLET
jgi:hypothetical protein